MKLENAIISQWEPKCNSCGSFAVELTIRADMVKDGSYSTFCNPDVRRDFENYISQYKYGFGIARSRDDTELIKENEELKEKIKDLEEGLKANREEQKEWRQRFLNIRNTLGGLNTELIKKNEELEEKVKELELLFRSEQRISEKLREDINSLCDGQSELQNDLRKSEIERAKLEKDLMAVADILQVTGLRSVNDILDKAHYWVHERSINYEGLRDILRMDPDASRGDILDRIEELCRFRDDVMTTFGIKSCDESDIRYELYRAARLAEKTEFICGYFDVKQVPLTSIAENLCIEIKEKVISEYKAEIEAKRQDAIRDAAKKAGSVGNGVYLDGLTVEQNLRAENLRLKAENEKHKKYISELEGSLDCIHCESAAALGYECE